MFDRTARWQPDQGAAAAARAAAALALAALAVIHVVDLPGTLGPTPLVGIGYFGIIAAAVLTGGPLGAAHRSPHWRIAVTTCHRSRPLAVSRYSARGGWS